MGDGSLTNDGKRVFSFSGDTIDTPSYQPGDDFYNGVVYTESSDPGVEGTKEATVRFGVIEHDTTDYSTGFLPVGPDRSGDTGTQYFTFAFQRKVVANFDVYINSPSGVSGLWIAAPGTQIDGSALNGWVTSSEVLEGGYAGSNLMMVVLWMKVMSYHPVFR